MRKLIFSALVAYAVITPTNLLGDDQSWRDFDGYDQTLVWAYEASDLKAVNSSKASEGIVSSQILISGIIEVSENKNESLADFVEFNGVINNSNLSGEIYVTGYADEGQILSLEKFAWNLGLAQPFFSFTSGSSEIKYFISPIIFPDSELPDYARTGSDIGDLFGNKSLLLELLLKSPDIRTSLPSTISRALSLDLEENEIKTDIFLEKTIFNSDKSYEDWICGLTCGGAIGTGLFAVASGGILSPGAALTAAACGACMGYQWNRHVASQRNVHIPNDGGGVVGSYLSPLPPGWLWECERISGGYSCTPRTFDDMR